MSWIIKNLLLDRTTILSKIMQEERLSFSTNFTEENYDGDLYYIDLEDDIPFADSSYYTVMNVEKDEYNFLLQLEDRINEMYVDGKLSYVEVRVLQELSIGNTYKEVGQQLEITVTTIRKIFNSTCTKIAFALGGVFTNEGYMEYMIEKHNLTEDEISKMITLIESNRRL